MSAQLAVVVANVAFVAGALVVAVLLTTVLVLRQRKPKSVEAGVESFNRGLRALAPDTPPSPGRRRDRASRGSRAG